MTDLDPDIADIVAGALGTSRAHAYELMADALATSGQPLAARIAEECAKVCEAHVPPNEWHDDQRASGNTSRRCAEAIRAKFKA